FRDVGDQEAGRNRAGSGDTEPVQAKALRVGQLVIHTQRAIGSDLGGDNRDREAWPHEVDRVLVGVIGLVAWGKPVSRGAREHGSSGNYGQRNRATANPSPGIRESHRKSTRTPRAIENDHNFNVIYGFTVVIVNCVCENPLSDWVQWRMPLPSAG